MTELLTAITGKWMDPILWACIPLFYLLCSWLGRIARRANPEYAQIIHTVALFGIVMCLHVIRYGCLLVAAGLKASPEASTGGWLVVCCCLAFIVFYFRELSRYMLLKPEGLRSVKTALSIYPVMIVGLPFFYSFFLPSSINIFVETDALGHIAGALILSLPWLVYLFRSKQTAAVWSSMARQ